MNQVSNSPRMQWMDLLRGFAILLLLFWHASAIPSYYGFSLPEWLFILNELFLPWRMPTLMFLSGMLLERSLRKSPRDFYVGKLRLLLWPYIIWAFIHMVTFSEFDGSVFSVRSWIANSYLWFIFFLFFYYLLAPVVVRFNYVFVLILFSAPLFMDLNLLFHRFFYFGVFFFSGYYLKEKIRSLFSLKYVVVSSLIAIVFTIVSVYLSYATKSHYFQYEEYVIPFVFLMILVSAVFSEFVIKNFGSWWGVKRVEWMGRNSVVFYLIHFPLMTLCGELSRWVGFSNDLGVIILSFAVSLIGGSLFVHFRNHVLVVWAIEAPSFRKKVYS